MQTKDTNTSALYVTKWASGDPYSRERGWRLLWASPGSSTICYAEGECSRRIFSTMRAAVAHGLRQHQEKAQRFDPRFDQW